MLQVLVQNHILCWSIGLQSKNSGGLIIIIIIKNTFRIGPADHWSEQIKRKLVDLLVHLDF